MTQKKSPAITNRIATKTTNETIRATIDSPAWGSVVLRTIVAQPVATPIAVGTVRLICLPSEYGSDPILRLEHGTPLHVIDLCITLHREHRKMLRDVTGLAEFLPAISAVLFSQNIDTTAIPAEAPLDLMFVHKHQRVHPALL